MLSHPPHPAYPMSTPPEPLAALRSEVEQERAAIVDARSEAHTLGKLARETLREACQDPDLTPLERADVAFKLARSVDVLARHTLDRARRADTLAALSWELPLLPDGLGEHTPESVLWALARGDLPAPPEARAAAAAQLAKLRAARQAQADRADPDGDDASAAFWAAYNGHKEPSTPETLRSAGAWTRPGPPTAQDRAVHKEWTGEDLPDADPADPEAAPAQPPDAAAQIAKLRARYFGGAEQAPSRPPVDPKDRPPLGRDLRQGPLR